MRVLRHLAMLIVVASSLVVTEGLVAAPQPSITVRPITTNPKPGDVFLLEATASAPLDRLHARVFDRVVAMWPDAKRPRVWQALIGVDVEAKPGQYPLVIEGESGSDAPSTKKMITVAPKVFGVRRLRVDPRFAEPPESERARIEREAKRLHEIYATLTPAFHWTAPLTRPVSDRNNSSFGVRSVFNGEERGRHNGVDFASPAGTPVHAPAAGRVALAEDLYYTGNTVIIDHGHGLYSVLAHFERTAATAGQHVEPGDVVGYVGATGRVTGPHLHWSVRLQDARVDPLSLLRVGRTAPTARPSRRR